MLINCAYLFFIKRIFSLNTTKKITFLLLCSIALSTVSTQCFFNNGGPNNAFTGAAIGGLAGGRRGAAIGLGV